MPTDRRSGNGAHQKDKGERQRLKIQTAMPGSLAELARKTGYSKKTVARHIVTLRERGVIARAYIFLDKVTRKRIAVYGEVGNLPPRPVTVKAPKPKPPPPPRRTFVIDSPWRTIWQGANPYEGMTA